MDKNSDVLALSGISTILDDAQIHIILSSQCFKAQAFILKKLKNEALRLKEICHFVKNANHKLQVDIHVAEQDIRTTRMAQGTILCNTDLKKELLLTKEKKTEMQNHFKTTEKKYENLWQECEKRYESLPFAQTFLQRKDRAQDLEKCLVDCKTEIAILRNNIKDRRREIFDTDKSNILKLAEYLVLERNYQLKIINEKTAAMLELMKEIDDIVKKQRKQKHPVALETVIPKNTILPQSLGNVKVDRNCRVIEKLNDELFKMPKMQFSNFDLDTINKKLEQVKMKKNVAPDVTSTKQTSFGSDLGLNMQPHYSKNENKFENEYLSIYFKMPNTNSDHDMRQTENYSKRKLINILDDIEVNKNEAFDIMSKIDPNKLRTVNMIVADSFKSDLSDLVKKPKLSQESKVEIIEISNDDDLLAPPTQFMDMTQKNDVEAMNEEDCPEEQSTSCNEDFTLTNNIQKNNKAVTFAASTKETTNENLNEIEKDVERETNESLCTQLDKSTISDDFASVKNKILKERHLDLSPPFVYAKNNAPRKEANTVTSKFFYKDQIQVKDGLATENKTDNDKEIFVTEQLGANENVPTDLTEKYITDGNTTRMKEVYKPVKGLLFNHGLQAIPQSLEVTINSTCCEEGDLDYPQIIDPGLLLSPKNDLQIPPSNNTEVQSQDVPNFLSGLRKTGMSLFGAMASEQKTENVQNQANMFNFNFGSEELKSKHGVFNMFN